MTDKCKGFMGRIRCNFQPRYDEVPASAELVTALARMPGITNLNVPATDRYVCDVCTACGETRARPWPSEPHNQGTNSNG